MIALLLAGCGPPPADAPAAPWQGDQGLLVLPVAFTDAAPPVSRADLREAWFGERSAAAWVAEGSRGLATLTGDVEPWRTVQARFVDTLDVVAAAEVAFADVLADPSPWDLDGNGLVDHLVVVYAGQGPDRPSLGDVFVDGPADHTAVVQAAGVGGEGLAVPIGLYLHEAAHAFFRLPDRYGDHLHGDYGIGVWGIMGLGQWGPSSDQARADLYRYPVHFRAAAAARVGWVTPLDVTTSGPLRIEGQPVRIPGDPELWLEARAPIGFHAGLPGHGLLVWREGIGPDGGSAWTQLVQADGRDDLANGTDTGARPLPPTSENLGDDGDPFPGATGATGWTDPDTGVVLSDIRLDGDAVLLDVTVPGG